MVSLIFSSQIYGIYEIVILEVNLKSSRVI